MNTRRITPIAERFWSKVSKTDGCWLWTGYTNAKGYGRIATADGVAMAHRVSYEMHFGPIPDGMLVLHSCDTPSCVRPDHLSAGTHMDNMHDKVARRRHHKHKQTVCLRGHPFDEHNTYTKTHGERVCRACQVVRRREYRARLKAAA